MVARYQLFKRTVLWTLLSIVILVGIYLTASILKPGSSGIVLSIQRGDTATAIYQRLSTESNVRWSWAFYILLRVSGVSYRAQAGDYRLTVDMTPLTFLSHLKQGKVIQYKLTLIEGWTFAQMQQHLDAAKHLKHLFPKIKPAELLKKLNTSWSSVEGIFFPTTYSYHGATSDLDCYRAALKKMLALLEKYWPSRDPSLPYQKPYDALIVASLIERESNYPDEYSKIASVMVNRLKAHMRLQIDASVRYGLNRPSGRLTRKDLKRKTPYNTYLTTGLPPTPIAMPSAPAVFAALHPQQSQFFYYVLNVNGRHTFSVHFKQHQKAAQDYRNHRDQLS